MKTLKNYILESKYSSIKKLSNLDLAEGYKAENYDEALNYLKSFVKTDKQLFIDNLHKMFTHLRDFIVRGNFMYPISDREKTFYKIVSYLMKDKNIKGRKATIEFLTPISLLMNFHTVISQTTRIASLKNLKDLEPYFKDVIVDLLGNGSFDDFEKYFQNTH